MLIGIDGNEANIKNRVGVGRYAHEVLLHLHKIQNSKFKIQNDKLKFKIFLKEKPLTDLPKEESWWKYQIIGPKKFWTQLGLPLNLFISHPRPDVFFTPSHYAPRFCPAPSVISVMDLSYLHFPEMFKKSDLYQLNNWTKYSVEKAARVLTISKASRDDIIKYYRVSPGKVVVTYLGTSEVLSIKDQGLSMKNIKKKYGIEGDYLLSVGTLQPRKNYVKLIKALSVLIRQSADPGITLVIVGKKGWLWEEILAAPKKYGIEDKVKFLDFVPDEDLAMLYKNAKCSVLVSLYEGFGIPVLEAMAFGCPVITSNVSSLPEVAGEAGILVNPEKTEEITAAIKKVLELNPAERQAMINKGYAQAKKFSWEKCARETLAVLEEVGGKRI
jgi:glycosyltransferase involved in cell wall biosynthesis